MNNITIKTSVGSVVLPGSEKSSIGGVMTSHDFNVSIGRLKELVKRMNMRTASHKEAKQAMGLCEMLSIDSMLTGINSREFEELSTKVYELASSY